MKKRVSAGLLMYRMNEGKLEVLLAHPGGPYFAKKDDGHWTIPKGEPNDNEDLFEAAIREFKEETGVMPPGEREKYISLDSVIQKGGKQVHGWAFEGSYSIDGNFKCNEFEIEWPPRSGKKMKFPEIDRVDFFRMEDALKKIKEPQGEFLRRLEVLIKKSSP